MALDGDDEFASGAAALEDEVEGEGDTAVEDLLRELDIETSFDDLRTRDLSPLLKSFLDLPRETFLRLGLDLSLTAGMGGDWAFALASVETLLGHDDDRVEVKLWQMRCLVELERYSEALALFQAVKWEPDQRIHVNYLTGLCFESLGMVDLARQRFEAVARQDPKYRNIAQKTLI